MASRKANLIIYYSPEHLLAAASEANLARMAAVARQQQSDTSITYVGQNVEPIVVDTSVAGYVSFLVIFI